MALLSYLILLSAAQLIVAPPPMLLPNSTTGDSNDERALCDEPPNTPASNMSAWAQAPIATSTSPDQREFIDLGHNFRDLNESLSLYCLHAQESAYTSWKTTSTQATSIVTCVQNVAEGQWNDAGTYTETYMPEFTPTLPSPCCGQCTITASRASAFFWPTPAPEPKISTLVGADGFTYTSPSVYIMYDQLGATNRCSQPGPAMAEATVSLQPGQVSSVGLDGMEAPVNFADLTNCSTKAPSATMNLFGDLHDPCRPSLQYDISYLNTIQPEWASCVDVRGILYDPPRAVTSASALTGPQPQVTPPKAQSPTTPASALNGPQPRVTSPKATSPITSASALNSPQPQVPSPKAPSPVTSVSTLNSPQPQVTSSKAASPIAPASTLNSPQPQVPSKAESPIDPASTLNSPQPQVTSEAESPIDPASTLKSPQPQVIPPKVASPIASASTFKSPQPQVTSPKAAPPIAATSTLSSSQPQVTSPQAAPPIVSASTLNSPQPQVPSPKAASPSLTHSATPGAQVSQAPPVTIQPQDGPSTPKPTPTGLSGRVICRTLSQETPSGSTIPSSAGLPDPVDPIRKRRDARVAGQVSSDPVSDPGNATIESTISTTQPSAVAIANTSNTPTTSSPDASQANGSSKDPNGDPSDPSDSSSPQPLVIGDQKITVPTHGATALKVGSQTLNAQTPILTISNTSISLGSDKLQIGTSIHSFMNHTPTTARTVFTIGPKSFTLNPQSVTIDGTEIKVGGSAVTIAGTRISLGPSEFILGDKTETFAPATSDPVVEAGGDKEGVEAGIAAGSERNTTASAVTDAGGFGGALISGLRRG